MINLKRIVCDNAFFYFVQDAEIFQFSYIYIIWYMCYIYYKSPP